MIAIVDQSLRLLLVATMVTALVPVATGTAVADDGRGELRPNRSDLEQGVEVALAIERQVGLIADEEELAHLYDLGARIAHATRDHETVYSFYIVDMPEPNAFAVPGGFIFFTQGLLDLELGDDALGHLLGHEISHVRSRHASRMGFWTTITSILQAAVVIGAAFAVSGASSSQAVYEDEYGRVYTRYGGGTADALTSASVFSTIFRELFLRGYSRKLEIEADDEGSRLATAAGFPPEGGVELLTALHDRIYEDSAYSYWRTHPYFTDRLRSSEARMARPVTMPDSVDVVTYRQSAQLALTRVARRTDDEDAATLLYRNALRWGLNDHSNAPIQLELIRFRLSREDEKLRLDRCLGPLLTELDELAERLADQGDEGEEESGAADVDYLARVEIERERVTAQLDAMLPDYLALLDAPRAVANLHLQLFVDNFPAHVRAPGARLAMARRLLRDEQPDAAVPVLQTMLETAPGDSLDAVARHLLEECAARVTGLESCYEILQAPPDPATAELAAARMETLLVELDDLEAGARFLRRWSEAPQAARVLARVEELAAAEVRFGRVFEAGGKPQRALDIYNRVVLLVPDSQAATAALRGIERIQLMGKG